MHGHKERGAEFQATIVLQIESDRIVSQGSCRGLISEEIRGKGGFGYDPLFIPEDGDGRTFAEMTVDEKKLFSISWTSNKTSCDPTGREGMKHQTQYA